MFYYVSIFLCPPTSRSIQLHQLLTTGITEVTYLCVQCRTTHFRCPRELQQWLLGGPRRRQWTEKDTSSLVFLSPRACTAVGVITCTTFLGFKPWSTYPAGKAAWCKKGADSIPATNSPQWLLQAKKPGCLFPSPASLHYSHLHHMCSWHQCCHWPGSSISAHSYFGMEKNQREVHFTRSRRVPSTISCSKQGQSPAYRGKIHSQVLKFLIDSKSNQ